MRLAAGLNPDPLGSLSAPPEPLAAIGGGVLLLRGREGRGWKGEGRGWEWKGKGRERGEKGGRGKGRKLLRLYLTSGHGFMNDIVVVHNGRG